MRIPHTAPMFGDSSALDIRLEKRLAPRRNTMIVAQIVFAGGLKRADCIIRNLSDYGAKLEVDSVIGIPNTFDLIAPRHRPHSCRVAWRALKEMGVEFID
jgi:hypothetical protein